MRDMRVGFRFIVMLVAAVLWGVFSGCSHKTLDSATEKADTIRITDTVIVHARPDTVTVEIPQSSQSVVTKDTTSFLNDRFYESEARWDGQFLHHSLRSIPGAALTAQVIVHDTLKVKEKAEKHIQKVYKTRTVYVGPTWKDRFAWGGIGFLACGLIWLIYGLRKKIKGAWRLVGL